MIKYIPCISGTDSRTVECRLYFDIEIEQLVENETFWYENEL